MVKKFISILLALIFIYIFIIATIIFQNLTHYKRDLIKESNSLLEKQKDTLLIDLDGIYSDLLYLTEDRDLKNIYLKDNSFTNKINHLEKDYLNFIDKKKRYDQLRFLDESGFEIIRINFNRGKPFIVSKEKLQSKQHRYYFREAFSLNREEVYTSPFDLNMEYNEIEVPLKPMIRFATPVFDYKERKIGVIILNYLGEFLINDFRNNSSNFKGFSLLLNSNSYYIVGFNREDEWSFMFKNRKNINFALEYPNIWDFISNNERGDIEHQNGIFQFKTLTLNDFNENCKNCSWKIVNFIPDSILKERIYKILYHILPISIFIFILLVVGLWVLILNLYKRGESEREVENLNREIKEERNLFIGGPSVIFKLKNEYGWPVEYVSANVGLVLGYSQKQFLSGEITYSSIITPEYIKIVHSEIITAERNNRDWFEHSPYQVINAQGERIWLRDTTMIIRDSDKITHFFVYINDITKLKEAEEKLKKSKEYIQKVVDAIADPTLVIDVKTHNLLFVNKSAKELYLKENISFKNLTCYKFSHKLDNPCSGEKDPCPINTLLENKKEAKVIHTHYTANREEIFVEVIATPILNEKDEVIQIIESHRDITKHIKMQQNLDRLANTDKLTQIYNRVKFDKEIKNQIDFAKKNSLSLALIMFDIDHFKKINDTYGHDKGDFVLKELTALIKNHIRQDDIFARWGGEEFMVLVPNATKNSIYKMAENLRKVIEKHNFSPIKQVTSSFGITILKSSDNVDSFIKRVDLALYKSKDGGRNIVTIL